MKMNIRNLLILKVKLIDLKKILQLFMIIKKYMAI